MINFKLWYESNELDQILPPIPEGSLRATHFTGPTSVQALLSGEPFRYNALITSTTDGFSNNNDVLDLIKTGKTGAFTRDTFGRYVVILDIPHMEYRRHSMIQNSPKEIDNSRILGIIDRDSMSLTKNPGYDPTKQIEMPEPVQFTPKNRPMSSGSIVQNPEPSQSVGASDVW